MRGLVSFIVGFLFAIGLGVSGMTKTHIVKGFLDITGSWNPSLIGVMAGAIAIHLISYFLIKKRKSPFLDSQFYIPIKKQIDKKLISGAAIFGAGWGWAGICPGPAVVSLASGNSNIVTFVIFMIFGMYSFKFVERKI